MDNANPYFSPMVVQADQKSFRVRIDSEKNRNLGRTDTAKHYNCSLNVFQSAKSADFSYAQILHSSEEELVFYTDVDGEFLPDRRWTKRKGMKDKLEKIMYSYEEIEKDGTGQPATRSESDSKGSDKPQPESEGRSR